MTSRELSILLLMAGSSLVWAGDRREKLEHDRAEYRQAVAAHGASSIEAKEARRNLRESRHAYHEERRQHERPDRSPLATSTGSPYARRASGRRR